MILTLAMVVLFVLLAIGSPVGFAMAGSGVAGLYLVAACRCCQDPADRPLFSRHILRADHDPSSC